MAERNIEEFEQYDPCPHCEQRMAKPAKHLETCGKTPFQGNTCPMCGEKYESYTRHILEGECAADKQRKPSDPPIR